MEVLRLLKREIGDASMKVPPKRKGNTGGGTVPGGNHLCLNESPSEKEGKSAVDAVVLCGAGAASMKVPPKRKGNI